MTFFVTFETNTFWGRNGCTWTFEAGRIKNISAGFEGGIFFGWIVNFLKLSM